MKTVAIYHRSVPNAKNAEKYLALQHFAEGVVRAGDRVIDVFDSTHRPADVAVIQGWVTDHVRRNHQWLRAHVIEQQRQASAHVVAIDSCLFLYADTANPAHYLRYSFDGIFPSTGIYCDSIIVPDRWRAIANAFNIDLKPWRQTGNHILLCLQRNGGWSMGAVDTLDWCAETILTIREHSDRPIVIRPHPGDGKTRHQLADLTGVESLGEVSVSDPQRSLLADLHDCWAAVNHNSSSVVGALIEGVPVFVTDPERSQCREVANLNLSDIENPTLPDRNHWIHRVAMSHWNFADLADGSAWSHMRRFI